MEGSPNMRLCFLWWWDRAEEIYPYWRDGLRAAIEYIGRENDVDIYLGEMELDEEYDAILFWGDSNCSFFNVMDKYKGKKGIILTTDPHNMDNLKKLDVVFCESQPIYDAVRAQGIHAVKAFGTDSDFYEPDVKVKKDIEYFYPATFSPWKRQSTIAHYGNKLTCIGTVQPDGQEELEACKKAGVNVEIGYFPAEKIREYYQRAKNVPIPAIHGSERTVLEAMACNIVPLVNTDNKRALSYVLEYAEAKVITPRDFIESFYSHKRYAQKILKGFQ